MELILASILDDVHRLNICMRHLPFGDSVFDIVNLCTYILYDGVVNKKTKYIHLSRLQHNTTSSTDTYTYMDRQTDTLRQHNTYLLTFPNRHTYIHETL